MQSIIAKRDILSRVKRTFILGHTTGGGGELGAERVPIWQKRDVFEVIGVYV